MTALSCNSVCASLCSSICFRGAVQAADADKNVAKEAAKEAEELLRRASGKQVRGDCSSLRTFLPWCI